MALLRSGVVLFVSVTAAATAIMWGLFYVGSYGHWPVPSSVDELLPVLYLSAVTFATSILLMVLAWRGRRQPVTDGIVGMTVLVLTVCLVQFILNASNGPKYPDSMPMFTWALAGIGLASLVPAHLICYFALCRTPLLHGLAPPPKSRRPAEAGL